MVGVIKVVHMCPVVKAYLSESIGLVFVIGSALHLLFILGEKHCFIVLSKSCSALFYECVAG